jgi:hypothetical protein
METALNSYGLNNYRSLQQEIKAISAAHFAKFQPLLHKKTLPAGDD